MSITFTSGLSKPSGILDKPGNLERPEFGTLYGFDAPQEGPLFDPDLIFPTIQVFDNESEFIDSTDAPEYTIVHAKDTDKLYVWDGIGWYLYSNDSIVT